MAAALPPEPPKLVVVKSAAGGAGSPLRLNAEHERDLRDVARGLEESDVGIRTRYLLEDAEQASSKVRDDREHVSMYDLEAFCDRFGIIGPWSNMWRKRIRRCRAALRRMSVAGGQEAVGALHVFYGYPDPSLREWPLQARDVMGEHAPLLRYTEATEEARRRLVREALVRPMGRFVDRVEIGRVGNPGFRAGPPTGLRPLAVVVNLADVREREQYLDRIVSSGDAIRESLAPFREVLGSRRPGESNAALASRVQAHGERSSAHGARRRAFLEVGRRDAEALLGRASRQYHAAWLVAAGD